MIENVHHSCGIAAVSLKDKSRNVVPFLYQLLINMQNRGQLSAGFTTYDDKRPAILKTHKDIGGVNEVFRINRPDKMNNLYTNYGGHKGIGHVRYATCGANDKAYAQPFERTHGRKYKWFSMCFNGNLANYSELRDELMQKTDYHLVLDSDTEVIMHNISRELRDNPKKDPIEIFGKLAEKFDGAYNIAMINAQGEIIVNRDPNGLRPLVWGENKDGVFVASESSALLNVGLTKFQDIEPGTLLHIKDGKAEIKRYASPKKTSRCMFEWVYFANVSSTIDTKSVYMTRNKLGRELAQMEDLKITKDNIVVPVPDTSKPTAEAMAYGLKIPMMEGLIRNRYLGRTFIEGTSREQKVKNKYTIIREILKDKKVILVDDSIVRGTTLKQLVKYIKNEGGAKEVHIRIACPAIMAPCFYGIDMSSKSELLVPHYTREFCGQIDKKTSEKIADDLGADSLRYMTHEGLVRSIGLKREELCMACLDCKYPTKVGMEMYSLALANFMNGKKEDKRITEARTC